MTPSAVEAPDAALAAFGYQGKRVLVVGGASGIGAATAQLLLELGADVVVADFAEVPFEGARAIRLDLRDPASVRAAVEGCDGPIHALFSCAGISSGELDLMHVNFIGQRDLIERCADAGLMPPGSSVGMIASGAGLGWERNMGPILELIDTPDAATAEKWCQTHPEFCHYGFSKQVVIAYCARRSLSFLQKGVRINALCPTSTDTPLARRSFGWLEYGTDYREAAGIDVATPRQQAYPLVFLCSDAASYISGAALSVDCGLNGSRVTGTFQPRPPTLPAADEQ
jgi:NAD(P)-dependent dehydrogenase (short-subunit alcohol dehydrogenase family)